MGRYLRRFKASIGCTEKKFNHGHKNTRSVETLRFREVVRQYSRTLFNFPNTSLTPLSHLVVPSSTSRHESRSTVKHMAR